MDDIVFVYPFKTSLFLKKEILGVPLTGRSSSGLHFVSVFLFLR